MLFRQSAQSFLARHIDY